MYHLVPMPQMVVFGEEVSNRSFPLGVCFSELPFLSEKAVSEVCPGAFVSSEKPDIDFVRRNGVEYGYRIVSKKSRLTVFYSSDESAFNALVTLWQISRQADRPGVFEILDRADIENRGFMLDISRGKVPTVQTVCKLADLLARFKYNQLQLYIEGFSFEYPSFSQYSGKDSSLSSDEIREISRYCKERFIELVPNQNSLGHMMPWLAEEEFSNLAECESGFSYAGYTLPATTLDACNRKSSELVEKMADDLFSCCDSDKIHMGLDESFELCRGKNKNKDSGAVFADYVRRLNQFCRRRGKRMMMWADGLHRFHCFDKGLPGDIIYLEWGYEKEYSFDAMCRKLRDSNLDFYVCPGTSSWLSFTGLTDNMMKNIENAVGCALEYGALGVLLTDWGDCNHMQPLPVSYAAIIYCGALVWNGKAGLSEEALADALNTVVFEDKNGIMGRFVLEAGRYYLSEEFRLPCRTLAHLMYSGNIKSIDQYNSSLALTEMLVNALAQPDVAKAYFPIKRGGASGSAEKVMTFVASLKTMLAGADVKCSDAGLIRAEYENALDMVLLFTQLRKNLNECKTIEELKEQAETIAQRHRNIWLERNKKSGLEIGLVAFETF